jgi:hypothetical protein
MLGIAARDAKVAEAIISALMLSLVGLPSN